MSGIGSSTETIHFGPFRLTTSQDHPDGAGSARIVDVWCAQCDGPPERITQEDHPEWTVFVAVCHGDSRRWLIRVARHWP